MEAAELRRKRKVNPARAILDSTGWYHSFQFDDGSEFLGVIPVETLRYRYSRFPLPPDLTGKRVLDIGAWDGWFSFEAERRGAKVTAIDTIRVPNFLKVHRRLGSGVDYREVDLFELPQAGLGKFDLVFFLGVLYHTKYPVLALELVCGLTRDIAIVESYVIDADNWQEHRGDIPVMEFYETDDLASQLDNWFGPSVGCLMAMCRTAGFARVEVLHVENNRAALACYRHWNRQPEMASASVPLLKRVSNNIRSGINFRATRDEYLAWWFEHDGTPLTREDVFLQVGEVGVPTMHVYLEEECNWHASCRLPPGMNPGWYPVRLALRGGGWSQPLRIAVDVAATADILNIDAVCDSKTWARGEVRFSASPASVSLWITGLGENSDEVNTQVFIGREKMAVTFVGLPDEHGSRQVNAQLPDSIAEGTYEVFVRFGGAESTSQNLAVRP